MERVDVRPLWKRGRSKKQNIKVAQKQTIIYKAYNVYILYTQCEKYFRHLWTD